MQSEQKKEFLLTGAYYAVLAAALYLFLRYLLWWLLPFLLAFAAARAMEPVILLLRRTVHFKRGFSAALLTLFLLFLLGGLLSLLLSALFTEATAFLTQLPTLLDALPAPRPHLSKYAPKIIRFTINPDKIREVIGKGGSMIQKIVAESGAQVDIDDDGTIHIASPDAASCDAAKKMIDDICFVPEVGKLYYGKVVRILPIGAFVELAPGKDGMIHISKLENRRVEKVEDVLNIGDMTWVKVTEIDEKGRVNLSRKDALKELAAAADKK